MISIKAGGMMRAERRLRRCWRASELRATRLHCLEVGFFVPSLFVHSRANPFFLAVRTVRFLCSPTIGGGASVDREALGAHGLKFGRGEE